MRAERSHLAQADRDASLVEPVKILVVDDHPQDLLAFRAILASAEYDVVTESSPAAALEHLARDDFALIVVDVLMPGMDGFELTQLIKGRERSRHTPIIFLTADASEVSRLYRAYSLGAIDFLGKPIDATVVRAKVSVFADLFRKDRMLRRQTELLRESERRARELELSELRLKAERRYRNLAEAIPQMVWTATPDGALDYCNRHFQEYSGLGLERARNDGWLDMLHPDDVERCRRTWRVAVETASQYYTECRLRRASDGVYRFHLGRAVPERDESGRVVAWLGTYTDFEELKQALSARDEFLSIASHELRTPLTALKLRLQSLQRTPSMSESMREKVDSAARQTLRLERLMDRLLDVSRIATENLGLTPEECELSEVVNEVIERTRNTSTETSSITLECTAPLRGVWDRLRIEQVLTNLLENALKYGAGHPVRISLREEDGNAEICVSDSGVGIEQSNLVRIFERFERAGGPRAAGGLGMGLYIARQIVEAHAGRIRAESVFGRGSKFIVTLPLLAAVASNSQSSARAR